ncbi:serine/threonine protein kinase [Gigaspora margarita]|uniref:Serine/threonine protein kinase n=1 Tax=Gigaspora margarita TaxID=4874 RepID=A0A8H3XGQ7_GIGMA|nr:serine/threonine protein kinase [Gigaspora margarita]
MLKQYRYDMASKEDIEGASNEEVKLYKQIEQIEESKKDQFKSTQLSYQTNKQAIYTSVHLGFQNLPEPVNAEYSTSIKSIGPNDFQKNNLDLE